MKTKISQLIIVVLLCLMLTSLSCSRMSVHWSPKSDGVYESASPEIPPGHMPPPGKCRLWFPGKPPGQQPPPGDCCELEKQVPPGAWLIRG
jgi:hypothetical protein